MVGVALAAQTTVLLASRGEATELAVLVHILAQPVDPGVVADGSVGNINEDDLKVLVRTILCGERDGQLQVLVQNKLTKNSFIT